MLSSPDPKCTFPTGTYIDTLFPLFTVSPLQFKLLYLVTEPLYLATMITTCSPSLISYHPFHSFIHNPLWRIPPHLLTHYLLLCCSLKSPLFLCASSLSPYLSISLSASPHSALCLSARCSASFPHCGWERPRIMGQILCVLLAVFIFDFFFILYVYSQISVVVWAGFRPVLGPNRLILGLGLNWAKSRPNLTKPGLDSGQIDRYLLNLT